MYNAIFFDLDGTLTESGEGITKSVQYALEKLGKGKSIKVIGNDFLSENKKWMEKGVINFLIGQDAYVQGYEPVMILFRLFLDHKEPKEEYQYTEIVIKTKYNM